jgi:hypothetical protein
MQANYAGVTAASSPEGITRVLGGDYAFLMEYVYLYYIFY